MLKAAWVDLRSGRKEQGASTITMQLARSLWLETQCQENGWAPRHSALVASYQGTASAAARSAKEVRALAPGGGT